MNLGKTRIAFRTSVVYWAAAALWILLSDRLLSLMIRDVGEMQAVQSIKGWAFVTVTAALLYMALKTQIERAERARQGEKRAEELYQSIVEDLPMLVCRFKPDGRIEFVNEAYARCFERTRDELAGTSSLDLIPESERPRVRRDIGRLGRETPVLMHEHKVTDGKGNIRLHRWINRAVFDPHGTMVSIQSVGEDITEVRDSERAADDAGRMLQMVLDNIPQGVFWKDRDSRWLGCNAVCARAAGLESSEDLVGKREGEFGTYSPDQVENFIRTDRRVIESGKPLFGHKESATFADGGIHVLETNKLPMRNPEGEVIGVLGTWHDVTERQKAEDLAERMRGQTARLFEASPLPAVLFEKSTGRFIEMNNRFQELLSISREDAVGKTGLELGLWGDPTHRDNLLRKIEAGDEVKEFPAHIKASTGRTLEMLLFAEELDWINDPSILIQAIDITESRRMEQQLREAQKMEAIGHLAGGIAHDFNNILGAILGNAHLAEMDLSPGHPAHECVVEIQSAGKRAKNLVRQILAFSRQETPERRRVLLGPVVDEAVRLLRATLPAGVEIAVRIEGKQVPIRADANQIHQVILNLCTNAWHAMEDRGGRIEIGVDTVDLDASRAGMLGAPHNGPHAVLRVRDNGSGMTDATVARIFDPFFTTKEVGMGTGLGLSVVHGIVETHEGAIHVESTEGEGTAFQLYFPAADDSPAGEDTLSNPVDSRGQGQHILYIDDEEPLVFLSSRLLTRKGYKVSGFTSPAEAIKEYGKDPGRFDVIVTDFNMPGTTGLRMAERVLSINPDASVILTTGFISDGLRDKAAALGIREVVYKPDTVEELSETIHAVLSSEREA